jgi:hypothetical protein
VGADADAGAYIGPGSTAAGVRASDLVVLVGGRDEAGRRHEDEESERDGDTITPTAVQIGRYGTVLANTYAPNGGA